MRTLLGMVLIAALLAVWFKKERVVIPGSVVSVVVRDFVVTRNGKSVYPLSIVRTVRPDGRLSLGNYPGVYDYGEVHVSGLTPWEMKAKVAVHLRRFLSDDDLGLIDPRSGAKISPYDTNRVSVELISRPPMTLIPIDLAPFWLSLRVASLATFLIFAAGVPTAYGLARSNFPGKGLVSGLILLPLVLPPTVLGFALLQVLGRRAPLGMWLESQFGVTLVFHWTGAVVASAVAAFPLFLIPSRAAFEGVDLALEDAARLLGRREASVFWNVTFPLAWRGITSGTVLAFARAVGDFGATLMVAGDLPGRTRTASLAIFNAVQVDDLRTATWLTALIATASVAALLVAQKAAPPARGTTR